MDKSVLYEYIDSHQEIFTEASDRIWEFAELSLKEVRSAQLYIQLLRQEGFSVQEGVAGIETAFCASFGTSGPRIGILAEYDALSSLSQKSGVAYCAPEIPGGNGHGCGHNLLGAGALAAAFALKKAIEDGVLSGTVVFYGCPGEEGCASKAFMAREGMFRDLDAALTWHPGDTNEITSGSCAACLQYEYQFTGVASHAAGEPEHGRSALDAAELMNVGVQFLREHMRRNESVHYSFLDVGGPSPNVVQPRAKVLYMVRSDNVRNAKRLLERVHRIAQGAAMMTETRVSWRQIDGTSSTLSNEALERLLHRNLVEAPSPAYTSEEMTFAAKLRRTYQSEKLPGTATTLSREIRQFVREATESGRKPLNDFVMPYVHSDVMEPSSTDVGDVSWLTPTAQFHAVTWTSNAPGHSWQNVSMGRTSIAHKGLLYAGKVLAGAAADLMENAQLLDEAKADFLDHVGAGYNCPLEPDLTAEAAV